MNLHEYVQDKFKNVKLWSENLHQYQNDGEEFLYDNPFSAVFMDTGLGKTATLLKLMYRLVINDECKNILIVGPHRVVNVTWPDEFGLWGFGAPLNYTVIKDDDMISRVNKAGQVARKTAKLEGYSEKAIVAIGDDARQKEASFLLRSMMIERSSNVYLIHKEALEFLVSGFGKDWPFDVVIIDESSCMKDHRTKRWKAFYKVRKYIKRLHELTATPTAEGYIHLYGQICLLDQGERLGKTFTKFSEDYFTQDKYTRKFKARPNALEEISEKISDICLVMKQEDYLDLEQPKLVKHIIKLSEEQITLYKKMESECIIEVGTQTDLYEVEAKTASELSKKLEQMASGVVYQNVLDELPTGEFKSRRIVHPLHDEKIEKLQQLVEELNGENILVAYYHQSSLERILKAFPKAKAMDKDGKLIAEWNKGKLPMLLLHPQANAHGLNLQHGGRHVVFFDLTWSYENYYQLYRRLARQGQKYLVLIHQLIVEGTIDEVMSKSLEDKCDGQEIMFKFITKLRRAFLQKQKLAEEEL